MARNYHLEDVNWAIYFDEKARTINGDVTNTLTPLADGITQIALNEGKLTISKVAVNGAETTYTVDAAHEQMVITLPKPANKGDQLKVEVTYTGTPQAGVYFVYLDRSERPVTTNMIYTQGEAEDTRYWMPTYDEPDDKATSECEITVPADYFALSNGALLDTSDSTKNGAPMKTYHWKCEQPHATYLNSFVAGKYIEGKEKWGDLPVNWYVPAGTESMGEPTFGGTADMVRFYSELTGIKYPYAKFAQSAVADFPFGGMENISAVTQMIDALHPPKEHGYEDIRGLVLHELAHQWFGDLETCANWPNIWLNEGFATFLPHFYFRYKDGEDEYQIEKLGDIEGAMGAMEFHARPMIETKYSVPMDLFMDGHAYEGGSARLFTLQAYLGEKTFWKGIHQFLVDYGYKAVTTDQFFASMSKTTGKDLSVFEKEFFHTAALPKLTVKRVGNLVTITQFAVPFHLDMDFWDLHNGQWVKHVVALHGTNASVRLAAAKDAYVLDPEVNWVATITYDETFSQDQLIALYKNAPNAAAKQRVLELYNGLIQEPGKASQWLVGELSQETSLPLRRLIGQMLPSSFSEALISLSKDPDRQIQFGAVNKLAGGGMGDSVKGRLNEIWASSEAGDLIKAPALRGLLRVTKDEALAEKAYSMDSFGDGFRTTALDWWTTTNPDKARQLALAALAGAATENLRLAAIRTLGGVKDKSGQKVAFNALIDRLKDPSLHEKLSGVRALMDYGDAAAVPALHQLDDFSMYQLRVEAQQAEAALEKK
jgi:aminopeptidase N